MARIIGYILEVEADDTRDLDKQRDNLFAIEGIESAEFIQGWFGDPSSWRIEFHPPEKWTGGLAKVQQRIDRAVKTRKVKKGHISAVFSNWVSEHQKYLDDEARKHPMGFYCVAAD